MKTQTEQIQLTNLTDKEVRLLGKLYVPRTFPYTTLSKESAADFLNVKKTTVSRITKNLQTQKLIRVRKGYVVFYEPIKDFELRRIIRAEVFRRSGIEW